MTVIVSSARRDDAAAVTTATAVFSALAQKRRRRGERQPGSDGDATVREIAVLGGPARESLKTAV